ncbi:DNA methyltransferase [Paenibacillus sp. 79R4]|uniref:MGMT family protein n=1 Tax=Paenibacillus sp. 79R4 TaxID=2212847 RepID=UPI0015BDCCD2|nr:MGMT family protein [Paenibacillus sp. 79R4]NWL88804.1 DNA methyltransferase [Paenibacillus sp. 79R4]
MQPFTTQVIHIISSIPEGKVMTYGQIAKEAGSPRAARQVVRILHSMSRKYQLPWHRVVNSRGEIALQDDEGASLQRMLLEAEGVYIGLGGGIDLQQYLHQPAPSSEQDSPEQDLL